jgi:hypothetical protein
MILSLVVWRAHVLTHHAPESDLLIHFVFAQKNTRTRRAIKNPPVMGGPEVLKIAPQ